jgi:hypothetical protein
MLDARFWIKKFLLNPESLRGVGSTSRRPETSIQYLFVFGTMFDTKTLAQTEIMCQPFQDFGSDKKQYLCK